MKFCFSFFILTLLYHYSLHASELQVSDLPGFHKESISNSHYRFVSNDGQQILHVQLGSINSSLIWQDATIQRDIQKMQEKRKQIYEVLGFNDVSFGAFIWKDQVLTLSGQYKKLSGKKIYFEEKNFYRHNRFLQLKILSENASNAQISDELLMRIKPLHLLPDAQNDEE